MAELDLRFVDAHADALDPALRAWGQGAERVDSVKDFVDQVLARLGPEDCIRSLVLIGHGSPGNLGVGSGRTLARSGRQSLDLNNVAMWEPQLRRLRCRFCKPDGEFLLIGCNTGAGLAGARLLRLIVNFIRCCRARAPVNPVTPLTGRGIEQIVEAIGESESERARLPEPIEPDVLKTAALAPQLGRHTLLAGRAMEDVRTYDPAAIVDARYRPTARATAKLTDADRLAPRDVKALVAGLRKGRAAWSPLGLYAVEGRLQLKVRVGPKRAVWLPPGAVVGGHAYYSPLGDDTTLLYPLPPELRKRLSKASARRT